MSQTTLENFIAAEKLPTEFIHTVQTCYAPIAQGLSTLAQQQSPLVIGVQGCQGSGKSTLSLFLKVLLESEYQLNTAVLSIDDFYLTKAQRNDLAQTVHPLLKTRGVPGTHDVELAIQTIDQLKHLAKGETLCLPRFDKAADDRAPESQWEQQAGPVSVVILEGWCVGLGAQKESELIGPLNELEVNEDPDATWRRYANQQLNDAYPELFKLLDKLIVLKAPSFECVKHWRSLQEQKLAERVARLPEEERAAKHIMSEAEVLRFICHYQRLTDHALTTLPEQADWLLALDENHGVTLEKKHP